MRNLKDMTKPGKWAVMYLCVRGIDFDILIFFVWRNDSIKWQQEFLFIHALIYTDLTKTFHRLSREFYIYFVRGHRCFDWIAVLIISTNAISAYLQCVCDFITRCIRYNLMWTSMSVTCCMSVVFSLYLVSFTKKIDNHDIAELFLVVTLKTHFPNLLS